MTRGRRQHRHTHWLDRSLLYYWLTNGVARRRLTLWMARFSRIEHPLVRRLSIGLWRRFARADLGDARHTRFRSLHDAFIRELRDGARPVDPDPRLLVSPCDAVVGACGAITDGLLLQAKGRDYRLAELLCDAALARHYEGGTYVTLRLRAGMYHRFHAPADCRIEHVTYVAGDARNVNPATLARVDRLFCRNERAIVRCRLDDGTLLTLVPVAAILVASIRLHCLDRTLGLRYEGPSEHPCDAGYARGAELGWFEHGSTIIALAPPGRTLLPGLHEGSRIRMGQALFRRVESP